MKLKITDYLCPAFLNKSKNNILLSQIKCYFDKLLSVEHIFAKMNEIDKLKFILLGGKDEIILFDKLKKQNIKSINNNFNTPDTQESKTLFVKTLKYLSDLKNPTHIQKRLIELVISDNNTNNVTTEI
jgi:hypothetical protein